MVKILVVGGYVDGEAGATEVAEFGALLGREIIGQGHDLLNAALTGFDADAARGAANELGDGGTPSRIRTWIAPGATTAHDIGQVLISDVPNWDPAEGIEVPEPIEAADVLIFVRGYDGINRAALWADSVQKPVLPLASFGGASGKLFKRELNRLGERYTGRISRDDFMILSESPKDLASLARRVVSLAENILVPRRVTVAMSYASEGDVATHLNNLFGVYEEVCEHFKYECRRVTELNTEKGIISAIKRELETAGIVFVDLTDVRPNVLFEFGYVDGLNKDFIVTARDGTELPFDVQDVGVIFWKPDDMKAFKEGLTQKFEHIAVTQGHTD